MNRKILIVGLLIVLGLLFFWYFNKSEDKVVSSKVEQAGEIKNIPDSDPRFDSSTDLNAELENINPQVTDSDFSDLKNLINEL